MTWHPNAATNQRLRDVVLEVVNIADKDERQTRALYRIAEVALEKELGIRTLDFVNTLAMAAIDPTAFNSIVPTTGVHQ